MSYDSLSNDNRCNMYNRRDYHNGIYHILICIQAYHNDSQYVCGQEDVHINIWVVSDSDSIAVHCLEPESYGTWLGIQVYHTFDKPDVHT